MHFIAVPILYTKIKLFCYLSFHKGLKIIYICLFGIFFKWRNFPVQSCGNSVQFSCSVMSDSLWPHGLQHTRPPCLSIINYWSLLKLMTIISVMPSNHLIVHHPLLLPPSIFPGIRVFSNESVLHIKWPKYWTFSFSISLTNEYSRIISFRMDWLDLLELHRTLKSLFQHHSSKASILWCLTFFMV